MRKLRITWFFLCCLMLCSISGCTVAQYEPEEGIWFCEELQIQLSYERHTQTFAIRDGEKIICACGSDRGVPYLSVSCQETNNPNYSLAEEIFYAKIVSLDQEKMVVREENSETKYTFYRVE